MVFSRITVGEWFVSGGFFVPDETLRGQPAVVFDKIAEGVGHAGRRLARALRATGACRCRGCSSVLRPPDGRRC